MNGFQQKNTTETSAHTQKFSDTGGCENTPPPSRLVCGLGPQTAKIREKIRRPKKQNPRKIRSAKNRP